MKKLEPLGTKVLVEVHLKSVGDIILPDSKNKQKDRVVTRQIAYEVGPDVKTLKKGDVVLVNKMIFQDIHRGVKLYDEDGNKAEEDKNIAYVLVDESEVVGKYV